LREDFAVRLPLLIRTTSAVLLLAMAMPCAARADLKTGIAAFMAGDRVAAWHDLLPLARKGDPVAQNYVAIMYAHGFGTDQDMTEAVYWYEQSAKQGYTDAQFNLGFLRFQNGNYAGAAPLLAEAAASGVGMAQYYLARMYKEGIHFPHDDRVARTWVTRAAENGIAQAQFDLALMLVQGQGGSVDIPEAYKWLAVTRATGYPGAEQNLAILAERMAPGDVQASQHAAEQWIAAHPPQ